MRHLVLYSKACYTCYEKCLKVLEKEQKWLLKEGKKWTQKLTRKKTLKIENKRQTILLLWMNLENEEIKKESKPMKKRQQQKIQKTKPTEQNRILFGMFHLNIHSNVQQQLGHYLVHWINKRHFVLFVLNLIARRRGKKDKIKQTMWCTYQHLDMVAFLDR